MSLPRALLLASAALPLVACSSESAEPAPFTLNLAERLATLGAAPCEDAPDFLCLGLPVPWDHAAPGEGTFPLAVAVHPATGVSKGPLVIVDGGPGYSGVADADDLSWLDPRLSEQFDLVYFDLRGLAGSGGLDCPEAASAWYTGGLRGVTAAERAEVAARAAQFVSACPAEAGWTGAELRYLTTAQAVEDIEAIRVALEAPAITLYGLSYGTQLSQEYARAHADTTRAVAIDGVVDLTLTDLDYATSLHHAVDGVLTSALAACDDESGCADELGDAAAAYDTLAAALALAPVTLDAPMPSGELRARSFTRADLDSVTAAAVDNPPGRSALLRALAAASLRSDFVPLRRLLDGLGGIEPETDAYLTGGFSDAIYYAITCNDYGRLSGGEAAYLARGEELAAEDPRSMASFYGDLPCATWTSAPEETARPGVFAPPGVPVMVINAEGDVATPAEQGETVWTELSAAGLETRVVRVAGGQHVMWGWDPCIDVPVTAFLLDPADPSVPAETACDVGMLAGYVPLSPATAAEVDRAIDLLYAFATELYAVPYFPSAEETFGCDRGGSVAVDETLGLTLSACAFFPDLTVDGTGLYDEATGTLRLEVTLTGAHEGTLTYVEDEAGVTVEGTFDGATVNESE